ncbi:monovalent cation/H+ antiporter subunit D [Aerolutibacter ruishenii]|uniref:Multisubunit potassium/proton antiporter, PhaD subunit (TC 2.A.63.1.1) n=1 Tax=Aerolutibacter ruishenii TaxID=686800 RepID=A0A562LKR7_9GAMM|nr:monovalent cation/H+ antiporter subunit D [Lysobacter ruishenii]TWI08207.1 multisubunit potassium/proton antiporter, PhaD subunit (TC 2.A.63.1.1) [Lysobacter ruishenii]
MTSLLPGLMIVPLVLPLMTAALLLLVDGNRWRLRALINVTASVAGLVVALALLWAVDRGGIGVYLAANWQAPFGIVLVADRLSVLMLVLVGVVGVATALYAEAGWARSGVWFHALFQVQLLGLNGVFLTGDLFNLFVFFEVLLAASYGLQLHGSGWPRVRAGMHYIAVNLLASSLFLVGLAVLYGVTGTLSMADLADKAALVPAQDRGLLHVGASILAVAFLIKAAVWPLNAWLVPAYSTASVPVAALFVLMTKVGFYVLFRLWTLVFSDDAGVSAHFGGTVLLYGGLATLAFGTVGLLASIRLERIAAYSVLVSSGTLLSALGMGSPALSAAAVFYVASATLAVAMLFLLAELVKRTGLQGPTQPPAVDATPDEEDNLDDAQLPMIGVAIPVSVALLGLAFVACALLVAGLPPLSGFLAKVGLLSAAVGRDAGAGIGPGTARWVLVALLLLSSAFATISLTRAGIRHFWSKGGRFVPHLSAAEGGAVLFLIAAAGLLTVFAEPAMRYATATAASLHAPRPYIDAVLGARARPGPTTAPPAGRAAP